MMEQGQDQEQQEAATPGPDVEDLRRQLAEARATIRRLQGAAEPMQTEPIHAGGPLPAAGQGLQAMLKDSAVVVFTQDTALRYTWLFQPRNPHTADDSPIVGKSDTDLFSAANAQMLTDVKRQVITTGTGRRQEMSIQGEDGERFYEMTFEPLRDGSGAIAGLSGTCIDVTDRHLADREIRLLAQTVASTRDSVALIDVHGKVLFVNDSFQELSMFDHRELIGRDISIMGGPSPGSPQRDAIARQASTESWHGEWTARKKDGTEFPVEVWLSPLRSDEGKTTAFVAVAHDITERKNLEQQLLQAQKLESIGTLAGGIAHDFNNILGIIIGHASLLPDVAHDPSRLSRSINAIQKAGERGASLVRQILTFARKTDAVFEPVNINDIASELGRMLEETFPRTIAFSLTLTPGLPLIKADRTQIHQTILNLCVNARDAMPGGGRLTIATERNCGTPGQAPTVRLTVTDTGTGMDEHTQRRIFEPFFTTKGPGKGSGLGLSVVYGIIENHGGSVTFESSPGQGTAFHLDFPAAEPECPNHPASRERESAQPAGTETLLVVEDEELLSELLKASLEASGYTVLVAADGYQALSMYESLGEDIALVISDLGLPRMTGRDLFLKIRAIRPAAQVVIATGYIDPGMRTELLNLGAAGFIQKPYLPADVARTVREVLKR